MKAFSEEALSSIILLLYLNPQCFAILLDFFVEASYELVSVQVPETYVVSPSKIGKDLFQFGGTEHRRFKLAVFVFVLDKPPGLALQENICRNLAGQEINVNMTTNYSGRFRVRNKI